MSKAWKTFGWAALAVGGVIVAVWQILAINTAISVGGDRPFLGDSGALDTQAYQVLDVKDRTPEVLDRAEALARRALVLSPYAPLPRLRIAEIEITRHGRLTREAARQYGLTYDLLPLDNNVAAHRIRFGLEHWDYLLTSQQDAVRNEAMTYGDLRSQDVPVRQILGAIGNPAGRTAARYWLVDLEQRDKARAAQAAALARTTK